MKKLICGFFVTVFLSMFTIVDASALTISAFEHSTRSAWTETIESESSAVTKSGSFSNFYIDPDPWDQGTWLYSTGSWAQATFSLPADTLLVQFESDWNDGIADFIVDGSSVGTLDTYNRGWFQVVISGLTLAPHTLRVVAAGPHSTWEDDIAIDVFGSKATAAPIPEPKTILLIGIGILGLVGFGRKKFLKQ